MYAASSGRSTTTPGGAGVGGAQVAAWTVVFSGTQPWGPQEPGLPPAAEHVDRLAFDVQVPSLQDHPGTPEGFQLLGRSPHGVQAFDPALQKHFGFENVRGDDRGKRQQLLPA